MLPRTKPIYPRYREGTDSFRIGAQRGLTKEIHDPRGHAWALLDLLDGVRTLDEVITAMQGKFPEIDANDVKKAISDFARAGFLDDATPTRYDTDGRYRRYVGNVNYFSHFPSGARARGAIQDVLCDTRVTLLGLGGGGSTALQLLLGVGVRAILAVDDDRVELTNLNRQLLFEESSVGAFKADAARTMSDKRNSLVDCEFLVEHVSSPKRLRELVSGADIVISAIDQPPGLIQRIVNKACVDVGVPVVFGLSQTTRGRVFSVLPGKSGCIDCLFLHYDDIDPGWVARFKIAGEEMAASPPNVAFAPNIMRICAELVDEVVRIRTGYLPVRSAGVQLEVDFETGGTQALDDWAWQRDPLRCPTCGSGDEAAFARRLGSPNLNKL